MKLAEATKLLIEQCKSIDGLEINFDSDNATLYWQNIRVPCTSQELPEAIECLLRLHKMEAYFE